MSDLRNHYQQIYRDLESHISNEEERNYVIGKFQELSTMFMDVIDRLTYITEMRVREIEGKQKEIEEKIANVQNVVDGIENDIYEDDETYEFEIVCPYCNHEFVTDINSEISTEVECPECHNMIELDWNEEEPCGHECPLCEQECEGMEEHFLDDGQGDEIEYYNHTFEEDLSDDIDNEYESDDENSKYEEDTDIQEKTKKIHEEEQKKQKTKKHKSKKQFEENEDFEDDLIDEDDDDM